MRKDIALQCLAIFNSNPLDGLHSWPRMKLGSTTTYTRIEAGGQLQGESAPTQAEHRFVGSQVSRNIELGKDATLEYGVPWLKTSFFVDSEGGRGLLQKCRSLRFWDAHATELVLSISKNLRGEEM